MRRNRLYYSIKHLIPRRLQIFIRRKHILGQQRFYNHIWPINEASKTKPEGWPGWPDRKKFALILTHDVERPKGVENCKKLMEMEMQQGFRSSFNFVPERYTIPAELRHELTANGFEVGVHGLNHDGKLYQSREIFKTRSTRINQYLEEWQASGFRSPSMHHVLDWIHDLNIEYDASTFDTDPFEPQPDGVCTIFPFWVHNGSPEEGYVELPYTLPQDFTLFVLMGHNNIDIWRKKLDWIAANGGMVLINVHPDYMNFSDRKCGLEEYPALYYQQFLEYAKERYEGEYWHALPREAARLFNLNIKHDSRNNRNKTTPGAVNPDRCLSSSVVRHLEVTRSAEPCKG
jgi:hypothetical protein